MSTPTRATDAVRRSLTALDAHEAAVRAFTVVDADRALDAARALDDGPTRPLRGVVLAVKDVFDTAELPTAYGSPIYAGFRPRADAAAVADLLAGGAVCLGKTVTTEFALVTPGPTTNPRRSTHTPGGSSMGSAASVAAGMADLALGSQTSGSVIRPASFCGVFGFKPSFGTVSTAGMKQLAGTFDTVGWFARDVETIDSARVVLTNRPRFEPIGTPPRIALARTHDFHLADDDCRRAIEQAADLARHAGALVDDRELPDAFLELGRSHTRMMVYEAAHALAWERHRHGPLLSDQLRGILDRGDEIGPDEYDEDCRRVGRARTNVDAVFGAADVLMTPAAPGEAPQGLARTGDPRFARVWTALGWPALSVPGLHGATGLPIGIQVVGRPLADATVLAVGAWLADLLAASDPDVAAVSA